MVGIDSTDGYPTWVHEEANLAAQRLSRAVTVHEPGILEFATQRDASGSFAPVVFGADRFRYPAAKAEVQASWRRTFAVYVRNSELRPVLGRQPKAVAVHRSRERT